MTDLEKAWQVATDPLWNIAHTMSILAPGEDADLVLGNPGVGFIPPLECAATIATLIGKPLLTCGHHNGVLAEQFLPEEKFREKFGYLGEYHAQVHARHTGEQAAWIASMMRELEADSILVCVHRSHRPRFFATLAEALRREFAPYEMFAKKLIYIAAFRDVYEDRLLDVEAETAGGLSDDPWKYRTKTESEIFIDEWQRYDREGYQQPRDDKSHDMLLPYQVTAYAAWWFRNANIQGGLPYVR